MKTYYGLSDGGLAGPKRVVVVEGDLPTRDLDPRFDLACHSPDGFNWGFAGSGPAQLALAICAHALGDDARALAIYQEFKRVHVANLGTSWAMDDLWVRATVERLEWEKAA